MMTASEKMRKDPSNARPPQRETKSKGIKYFLEIFSGTGRLAKAVAKTLDGIIIRELDLKFGRNGDLTKRDTRKRIKALIESGNSIGVWFGFPCGTFSSARRHDGKGAPPLRGNCPRTLKGLPNRKPKARAGVLSANKLLVYLYELCSLCMKHKVPFYMENPRSSKVWKWPTVRKRLRHSQTTVLLFDYCQFGIPHQKADPSRVLGQLTLEQVGLPPVQG